MVPAAEVASEILSLPRSGRAFQAARATGRSMGLQAVMMPRSASRDAKRAMRAYASRFASLSEVVIVDET